MALSSICTKLRRNAITHLLDFRCKLIAHHVVDEDLCDVRTIALRVHMLISPYLVGTVVGILKRRLYAIDRNGLYSVIIYKVRRAT